jgi:hypothetical protein
MSTSNVPVRIPDRQPAETTSNRQPGWRQDRKITRFVIKIGGVIPS